MSTAHLAIDLGASSGRAIVGVLDGDPPLLQIEEVHRFEHHACPTPTGPIWDLTGIWLHILQGLRAGAKWCTENSVDLQSVGADTWGVDYALLTKDGELLSPPHCYRDSRNEAACERVIEAVGGFPALYQRTGIQKMPFNTLFQLAAQHDASPALFDAADRLLFLPDLFHYWLSGEKSTELSIASTSSMLRASDGQWDTELIESVGLPGHLFEAPVMPGTAIGELRQELADEVGAPANLRVIAPATHDTGSAVAAVPAATDDGWAYLSSGTWSLLGAELPCAVVSQAACDIPFTNERGVGGSVRFLKNIAGLWMVQELRREFAAAGNEWSFGALTEAADHHGLIQSGSPIDASHPSLIRPGNMSEKLRTLAAEAGQPAPNSEGALVRCALESLADCYRVTCESLEQVLDKQIETLHIVGGGVQNKLLNQLTREATGKTIVTGPVEATAIGNLLVQAMGCGQVKDLSQIRKIVRDSLASQKFE